MDIEKIKEQVKEQISVLNFINFSSRYENRMLKDGEFVFALNNIEDSIGKFNVDVSFKEKTDGMSSRLWFDIYGPFGDSKSVPIHDYKSWTDTGAYISYDEFIDKIANTIGEMILETEKNSACKLVSLAFTAKFDVRKKDIDKLKRLKHHAEELLDLDSWPEIWSVYDVHVNAED